MLARWADKCDFVRGVQLSAQGRSVIALPATARDDSISRIVARLEDGVVTTARSDADIIVTEFGAAELRGQTLAERVRRMIAISHPAFRESARARGPRNRPTRGLSCSWGSCLRLAFTQVDLDDGRGFPALR